MKIRYLLVLLLFVGCAYVSTNSMLVSGKDIKCNPLTRSCSGEELILEINRTMNIELF